MLFYISWLLCLLIPHRAEFEEACLFWETHDMDALVKLLTAGSSGENMAMSWKSHEDLENRQNWLIVELVWNGTDSWLSKSLLMYVCDWVMIEDGWKNSEEEWTDKCLVHVCKQDKILTCMPYNG